jgi:predicted DNA-binding transcriptional regulator AlpA
MNKFLKFEDLKDLQVVSSRSSLHRQLASGNFPPPIKLPNGQIRWEETAIEKWIEGLKKS